jgi:hypothetical protein
VEIRNGTVARAQRVLKVGQDSEVRIEWRADRAMTVHLEGYDISVVVRPNEPAVMRFSASVSGRFPVHAHEGETRGGHSHGRGTLLWLEVHPK